MKKLILRSFLLLASAAFLSFGPHPGGEGFEVYVNGKLMVQRFGQEMNKPHTIRFETGTGNEMISIRYYHCGKTGKNRALTVKDSQENIVKTIRFADENNTAAEMTCRVSDLIHFPQSASGALRLYYSSSEIPDGRLLLSMVNQTTAVTASR
jgi:hypothetical protein